MPDAGEARGSCVSWVANEDVMGANGLGFASSKSVGKRQKRSCGLVVQKAGVPGMTVWPTDRATQNNPNNTKAKVVRLIIFSILAFQTILSFPPGQTGNRYTPA